MKINKSVLAIVISIMVGPTVQAQTVPDTSTSARITSLEEIVVTARRRQETAQDSPVALTVLNDALLDRYSITGIDSIASLTPGLVTGESGGAVGGSISLRGVGSGESQAFIDQAVSINIDGIPISTAQILRVAQMDLQQIEILRGPQALFFGKNSPGGIISLTTASPGDEFEMKLRTGYEFDAKEWFVDAAISGPITEKAGFRLAAYYSDMDGYIDVDSPVHLIPEDNDPYAIKASHLDAFPQQEDMFLRGTFTLDPIDELRISLKGTYADTEIDGATSYFSDITHCPYGNPQELYPVAGNCKNDGEIITSQIPGEVLALNPQLKSNGHRDSEQTLISATVEFDLTESLTLTSVTGYYDAEEELSSNGGYGLAPSNVYAVNYENEQISEELRLASNFSGPFNFLMGGFYEERELYTDTYIVIPTVAAPTCPLCFELPFETTSQDQESYSFFAQLLFDFTEQIELSVGGRYTHETKEVTEYTIIAESPFDPAPVLKGTPIDVLGLPTYPGDTKLDFSNFSPEVTLTYKPFENMMYFASYKEGYKSGGFDGSYTAGAVLTKGVNSFDPEEVSGFELGLKSSLMDKQVIFNATAYWYDYQDLQVATYDTAARSFGTGNAAEATVRGIELETKYYPQAAPGLELHATANFNDAEFDEFFAQCYKSQSQALGCDNDIDPSTGFGNTQDLSGVQLRKAPEFTATVGGYYETSLASGLMMSFSSDLFYSGKYNYGTDYQPYTEQQSFFKLDASMRIFSEDNHWELALIGRNLSDERNLVNGIDRTGTGGAYGTTSPVCSSLPATGGCIAAADVIGTPTRGRTLTLQATYRY
ncbi:TonB-dependent receptor [Aestuariicella hydrocarbonica]|uniref:TonB-dependent receptor n=1 Tax=Pseudomaricurvus hydrocarbonicus TaxID=1470433 RepID=A0A9E5MP09_9GAMM|nr:TonB-dependent receptor [Aestuariicella hydrocarbonica]NHO67811.1 TonB-dependent receptor [Aestuariicella hydrocarbonica]